MRHYSSPSSPWLAFVAVLADRDRVVPVRPVVPAGAALLVSRAQIACHPVAGTRMSQYLIPKKQVTTIQLPLCTILKITCSRQAFLTLLKRKHRR